MDVTRNAKEHRLRVTKEHVCIYLCTHVSNMNYTIPMIMLVLHSALWNELIHCRALPVCSLQESSFVG